MKRVAKAVAAVRVAIEAEVARQIRQHSRSSMKAEVCGVLIGREEGNTTVVDACIAGANATQGGAHVTFTQDTWQHIYEVKDKQYPDARIVGWYHSHPGFGVFLSDHDLFIHKNFFSSPQQIAWVYDPHNDEEGCFGWLGDRIEKIDDVGIRYHQTCGETLVSEQDEGNGKVVRVSAGAKKEEESFWMPMLRDAAMGVAFFLIGAMAGVYYVNSRYHMLPKDGAGVVIIDRERIAVLPPEIAAQVMTMVRSQIETMMKDQQQKATPPALPGNPGSQQDKGNDGKK